MKTLPAKRKPRGVIELLAGLQAGAASPDDVSTEERRMCVSYLRLEGYTQDEMAKVFAVHRATVSRDEKVLAERAAKMIQGLNTDAVAGGLIAWAKHLTARAMKDRNHALVWRIQKELVDKLESLGLVGKRDSGQPVWELLYACASDRGLLEVDGQAGEPTDRGSLPQLPPPREEG